METTLTYPDSIYHMDEPQIEPPNNKPDIAYWVGIITLAIILAVCIVFSVRWFAPDKVETTEPETTCDICETTVPETVEPVTTEPDLEPIETVAVEPSEPLEPTIPETTEVVEPTLYFDVPLSEELQEHIFALCEERDIDPAIIIAMIFQESTYDSSAIGDGGNSYGLMQIQPRWNRERMDELNCHDLLDPFQNVTVGIDILADYLDRYGSLEWSLMAYNGGPTYASNNMSNGVVSYYARNVIYNSTILERG